MALTEWNNEPSVSILQADLHNCKSAHNEQVRKIDRWLRALAAPPLEIKDPTRSKIVPKLIRKQAEWRYASLSEPFLSEPNIFKINPISFEDSYAAKQNELVLNNQFNTQINKIQLIDEYIRDAVNKGTAILRVDWIEKREVTDVPTPRYELQAVDPSDIKAVNRFNRIQQKYNDTLYMENVPIQWVDAIDRAQQETQQREAQIQQEMQMQLQQMQQTMPPEEFEQMAQQAQQEMQAQLEQLPPIMYEPIQVGVFINQEEKVINKPSIKVCDYRRVFVDPSCEGNLDDAEYIIYAYSSCKADLMADGRYQNVEQIPDTATVDYELFNYEDVLKDPARKKLTVYEYWGNWDVNGDGNKIPIVATWVSDVMIRLEENPYPDHKPPFVFVPLLPVCESVYGEPDGALLGDNQAISGAVTRGVIDTFGRSAASQIAITKDALDPINRKAFHEGRDFEINPGIPANQAIYQFTFPELPQAPFAFLQSLQQEAEALTGVKTYSEGITDQSLGNTATGIRNVLDASSKREMAILRRLADGIKKVARKIIAMNALWLNDTEVIRITNQDFVEIHRDDLAGNFDLEIAITSAEDNVAKAESLAFMLQTLGNTVDQGMTQMILSEICELRKMPELAERVRRFQPPPPDPMQEQMMQMQMQMMQAQIAKLEAEVQKVQADAQLSGAKAQSEMVEAQYKPQEVMGRAEGEMAKAEYTRTMARKLDQEYMDSVAGIQHQRDMELMGAQAKAQADKSMQEMGMNYALEMEKLKQKREDSLLKYRAAQLKAKKQKGNL